MALLTRAEFRDQIRRYIGIVPPVDVPLVGALPGEQPTNYPTPTNMQINQCLVDAIANINRECQYHVNTFRVPVAAADNASYGPFQLSMEDFVPNTSATALVNPRGLINDIQRLLWTPSGGVPVIIQPITRDQLDRNFVSQYYATPPSQPNLYYVEGYSVFITPAQSEAGTYTFTCGTGLVGLSSDGDTLDQCPDQFQDIFVYEAIRLLAMTQTLDLEAQERYVMYGQMADRGKKSWKEWRHNLSGTQQPTLSFVSYRTGYGTRRTVR